MRIGFLVNKPDLQVGLRSASIGEFLPAAAIRALEFS